MSDKIAIEFVQFGRIVQDENGRFLTPVGLRDLDEHRCEVQYLDFGKTEGYNRIETIPLDTPVVQISLVFRVVYDGCDSGPSSPPEFTWSDFDSYEDAKKFFYDVVKKSNRPDGFLTAVLEGA